MNVGGINIVPFFPTPYLDELFYSLEARYASWSTSSIGRARSDLYGAYEREVSKTLPGNLQQLFINLPRGSILTPEVIIERHTIFPIFAPFLTEEEINRMKDYMVNYDSRYVQCMVHGEKSHLSKHLKYCPKCMESDQYPYLHRVHQLRGVMLCPEHGIELINKDEIVGPRRRKVANRRGLIKDQDQHQVLEEEKDVLLEISKAFEWILNNRPVILGSNALRKRYYYFLQKKLLLTPTGCIRLTELRRRFEEFYSSHYLRETGYWEIQFKSWIASVFNPPKGKNRYPLRHLMMMVFLGTTPEEFFNINKFSSAFFGEGPWPCLNPLADHYQKLVVETCDEFIDPRIYGIFSCSCKFIYQRNGPDRGNQDRSSYDRIIDYGELWRRKVLEMRYVKRMSIPAISKVSMMPVSTLAIKLPAMFSNQGLDDSYEYKRQKYRKQFCDLKSKMPNATRKELRMQDVYLYEWLRVNDSNWMEELLPFPKKSGPKAIPYIERREYNQKIFTLICKLFPDASRSQINTVIPGHYHWLKYNDEEWFNQNAPPAIAWKASPGRDWGAIDVLLSEQVDECVRQIIEAPGTPQRVTKTAIAKMLGINLRSNKNKLPRTVKALSSVVEPYDHFRIRKMTYAASKNGPHMSRTAMLKKARVTHQGPASRWRAESERVYSSIVEVACCREKKTTDS